MDGPLRRWYGIMFAVIGIADTITWLAIAPLAALYVAGFVFILNEEIFTGTMALTLHPRQTDSASQ